MLIFLDNGFLDSTYSSGLCVHVIANRKRFEIRTHSEWIFLQHILYYYYFVIRNYF